MAQNLQTGMAKVGYAPLTISDAGVYTYSNAKWLKSDEAGGREYSAEPKGETTEIFADSMSVYSAENNSGYTINLTLLSIIDDIEKDWLNRSELDGGGMVEIGGATENPRFALFLIDNTSNNTGKTTIFLDCQATKRPSRTGKTSEGSFEAQFPQYQITARPRLSDKWVCCVLNQSTKFTTMPTLELATE